MIKFVQVSCPSSCPVRFLRILAPYKSPSAPTPGRPQFQAGPDSNFVAQGGNPNLDKNLDKELGQLGQLRAAVLQALSVVRPDSRQAIPCALPQRKPELGQELGQGTWTNFITCFFITEPLVQVRPGTWTRNCGLLCYKLSQYNARFQAGPDAETRTWTRTWTRNLDKFYHVFSSCRATCPSSPTENLFCHATRPQFKVFAAFGFCSPNNLCMLQRKHTASAGLS